MGKVKLVKMDMNKSKNLASFLRLLGWGINSMSYNQLLQECGQFMQEEKIKNCDAQHHEQLEFLTGQLENLKEQLKDAGIEPNPTDYILKRNS